jgi:hypothetical protein
MEPTLYKSKVRRCQHIKADGVQCNLPSVRGRSLCHRHEVIRRTITRPTKIDAPFPHVEDPASLQLAFNDIIQRILRAQISYDDAALVIRSLRGAMAAMRMETKSPTYGPDVIRDYSALSPHVDWERHMTAEDKQLREQQKHGQGRSITSILTKITRHLANETGIGRDELGPEEDDEPCYGADGKEIIVGPPHDTTSEPCPACATPPETTPAETAPATNPGVIADINAIATRSTRAHSRVQSHQPPSRATMLGRRTDEQIPPAVPDHVIGCPACGSVHSAHRRTNAHASHARRTSSVRHRAAGRAGGVTRYIRASREAGPGRHDVQGSRRSRAELAQQHGRPL